MKLTMDRKNGFTFLEVVMTVTLLSLAIIPMAGLMQRETKNTSMGRNRTFALHLASNILERLKMENIHALKVNFEDPAVGNEALSALPELNQISQDDDYAKMLSRFQRNVIIKFDDASSGKKAVITAQIQWAEGKYTRQVERSLVIIDDKI